MVVSLPLLQVERGALTFVLPLALNYLIKPFVLKVEELIVH
jgi:hypothetical protein